MRRWLRNRLPASWRLRLRQFYRSISDRVDGFTARHAQPSLGNQNLNPQYSISQPVRPTAFADNKLHNIRIAANRIHTYVIYPQQVFSFWRAVGKPSLGNGFRPGRNLIDGHLQESPGGGLCQLSGLLYQLVLATDLEVMERYPHSVDIYREEERYAPLGADATVVWGYKDLRFWNTLNTPLQFRIEVCEEEVKGILCADLPLALSVPEFRRFPADTWETVETWRSGSLVTTSRYKKRYVAGD
jgi:vancomycin resistance protein VanW